MLRRFVGACLVVSGLILSGSAWAITATVTGQSTGQSEKGGTFTVVKQTSTGKVTHYTGRINPATHKVTVHVPVKKGDTLYGSLDGGLTGKPLTDDNINGNVPVDFSNGVGPIPQPGTSTTYTPDRPYTPSYIIVSNPLGGSGFYIGGQGSYGTFDQRIVERFAANDTISNTLQNSKGIGSFGFNAGWDFNVGGMPGGTVGPTAAFNYIGQSNNQVFSNGAFIGTRDIWSADIGVKGGYWDDQRLLGVYGIVGARLLNYDLHSNFMGPVQSVNRTAVGFLFGGGVEASRPEWRTRDGQWTTFGQLTVAYLPSDTVQMPVFSPSFNYGTQMTQVTGTLGFRYHMLVAPPPPP